MIFYSATFLEDAPFITNTGENSLVLARSVDDLADPDGVLVLWGGEDIRPELYGHPRHSSTGYPSQRDVAEWHMLHHAISIGMPIVGICRGAQMLCAAAGGSLIQDVRGHSGTHKILTSDDVYYTVNSIHHQQMYLEELPKDHYELLAWSEDGIGHHHSWKINQPVNVLLEPEAVYFPKIKGLAIQWHPEYMNSEAEVQQYVNDLVTKYCIKEMV